MPLNAEFQQKLNQQAQNGQSTKQKEHPQDTMIVLNILVGDDTDISEIIPYATPRRQGKDSRTPDQFDLNRLDNKEFEHEWNTKDFFEVRWDGRPHRIKPGEQKFFPRYLADHFAKVLIDFMLTKRAKKEKLKGLVGNRAERAKLYKKIIVGVASYYNGDVFESEGLQVEREVDNLNEPTALNVGEVVNPALGNVDTIPEKIEEVTETTTNAKSQQELIDSKSRNELMKEASHLGIKVSVSMSKEDLANAILNF